MIVHLNDELLPAPAARVGVFDRGFLFGDGVYEGVRVFDGVPMAVDRHVRRMAEGLAEARIPWDASRLPGIAEDLCRANGLRDAFMYVQVTRGEPGPGEPVRARTLREAAAPTVFAFATEQPPLETYAAPPTIRLASAADTRWARGHLKSISLLGNVLAAYDARDAGGDEVLMHRDGFVTEACASNLILVLGGRPVTPALDGVSILHGVTRARCLELDAAIEERPVPIEAIADASEIILVGTTSIVTAAVSLDGRTVGDGTPGPVARRLLDRVLQDCRAQITGVATASATTAAPTPASVA
ncbi:MAG: aminotransferase class IV [Planctomycetota bacterium]